jgi:hypothetical protein
MIGPFNLRLTRLCRGFPTVLAAATGFNAALWGLVAVLSIALFPLPPLVLFTACWAVFAVSWALRNDQGRGSGEDAA